MAVLLSIIYIESIGHSNGVVDRVRAVPIV